MGNLEFCQPVDGVINQLKKSYKNISIGILGVILQEELSCALRESGFNVTFLDFDTEPKEHIRLIIASGDEEIIKQAKAFKKDRILYLIPDFPFRECFSNNTLFEGEIIKNCGPDYVFLDNLELNCCKDKIFFEAFSLLTDIIDILAVGNGLESLIKIKDEIMSEMLIMKNPKKVVELISLGDELLCNLGTAKAFNFIKSVLKERICSADLQFAEFFTLYIINLVQYKFTFFKNNGILLSADRVRVRAMLKKPIKTLAKHTGSFILREKEKSFILTPEELSLISLCFRRLKCGNAECNKVSIEDVLNCILIAWELYDWDGLTDILIGQGFIEGILNGIKS